MNWMNMAISILYPNFRGGEREQKAVGLLDHNIYSV